MLNTEKLVLCAKTHTMDPGSCREMYKPSLISNPFSPFYHPTGTPIKKSQLQVVQHPLTSFLALHGKVSHFT